MHPIPEPPPSLPNNPIGTLKVVFLINFWHLWYLTSKKIHNPVTKVFGAPLEYKFQQGQTLFSTATYRLALEPTQQVREILWDRVTQHKHNLSYSAGANVKPFTSTLFKHWHSSDSTFLTCYSKLFCLKMVSTFQLIWKGTIVMSKEHVTHICHQCKHKNNLKWIHSCFLISLRVYGAMHPLPHMYYWNVQFRTGMYVHSMLFNEALGQLYLKSG